MILPFYPHALGRFSQPLLGKPRHCSSSYNIEPYLLSDRSSPCLFSLVIPRMDHNCRIFRWLPMAHSFSHWKKTRKNHGRTAKRKPLNKTGVQNGLAHHPKMCGAMLETFAAWVKPNESSEYEHQK